MTALAVRSNLDREQTSATFSAYLMSERATSDVKVIYRYWQSASLVNGLPLYDDVVLGRTGRAIDRTALIRVHSLMRIEIVRAGAIFQEWIGQDWLTGDISTLSSDRGVVISDGVRAAFRQANPVHIVSHPERDGYISTYDLVFFPLSNRWGPPMVIAYIRQRDERHSLVDAIFESTSSGLLALAPLRNDRGEVNDFRVIALNRGAATLVGHPVEAIRWQRLTWTFRRLPKQKLLAPIIAAHANGEARDFEFSYPSGDGSKNYISMRISPMADFVAASLTDISDVRRREESFKILFHDSPLPMIVYDRDSLELQDVNEAAVRHYGYSRRKFMGLSISQLVVRSAAPDPGSTTQHRCSDGRVIDVQTFEREIFDGDRMRTIVAIVDITEQKRTEEKIKFLAHHDALTTLPNRVALMEAIERALHSRGQRNAVTAVICLDLDHFKTVNDTLGHPVGDALLQQVAVRLRASVRPDDVVARMGGDEFAIILNSMQHDEDVKHSADRIIGTISRPYLINGHTLNVGASAGIALAPVDGDTAEGLLKHADVALYRAKVAGKGVACFFHPEMNAELAKKRLLDVELRQALLRGEFLLHHQPIISTSTGGLVGREALVRWRHPERGIVSPKDFVPFAEESGLIVDIGAWVIEQACLDASRMNDDLKIAVNLSALQFRDGTLLDVVKRALANSGLATHRLELEITETALLQGDQATRATLHKLRELGTSIALDDFGTGYSSLSYLRSFPFDKIKIDQSFVGGIVDDAHDAAIVSAVAGLGKSLGMVTTAEWVETASQLAAVRQLGCQETQGYFVGRPTALIEAHRRAQVESEAQA